MSARLATLAAVLLGCSGGQVTAAPVADAGDAAIPDAAVVDAGADGRVATPATGTLLLADLGGLAPIPGGGGTIAVRILAPSVTFTLPATHDFAEPGAVGCYADHYDLAAGKAPPPGVDVGDVKITGYAGGPLLLGGDARPEIACRLAGGAYACTYLAATNGGIGPDPLQTPFPSSGAPIVAPNKVQFSSAGFSVSVPTAPILALVEDLTKPQYDATKDTVFHFTCPEAASGCPFEGIVVNVTATEGDPSAPSPTYGSLTCTGVASGGSIVVKKEAIAAMLGGDAKLKQTRTAVIRVALPTSTKDSLGNQLTLTAGRGVFGDAPR